MTLVDLITKEDLEQFKKELFEELRKSGPRLYGKQPEQKVWLKSHEVRKLLSISPGTLQNLRINDTIPYTKVGNLFYYKYEDIMRLLEDNKTR